MKNIEELRIHQNPSFFFSHDSDLVGNVKSVLVSSKGNISFFLSVRSHEGVDRLDLDAVEVLAGFLYHRFVGPPVHDEHQSIVVFDRLNR